MQGQDNQRGRLCNQWRVYSRPVGKQSTLLKIDKNFAHWPLQESDVPNARRN
jgi:hypothetical protein